MADEDLSLEKIKKLKVAELKARLSDVGLQVSGLKADLVARLCSYYESVPSEAPHIVKSEADSQGPAPLAVGDTIQRDYDPPDSDHPNESSTEETSQLPAPVETPQTDTTQSDFLQTAVAPEAVTEISGRNDGAVPEAELEGNSNDEYVNSFSDQRVDDTVITKPSAPSQEESVLEEPKQNEPEPAPLVEPETMTWQGVSSSSEVSHVELKEQSNSLEENVPASKQGDAAEVTVEVGQVVDEMITDIDKRGEESTMETSSGIYEKEERLEQIKDAQINDREAELDTTTLAEVVPEASEPSMPVEETQSDEKEAMLESSIPVDNAQSKTSVSEKRLPDVPQIPYQTIPDKETSSAQQREMDNSGAHTEQTKDLQLPPNETPAVAIERNENDTRTQATYALGKAPRVDEVMKESNKVRSVDASGGKELSHVSQIGSRGDDSGYDVDQGEQEPPQEGSKKKKKKKKRKKKKDSEQAKVQDDASRDDEGIEVEYVADTPELDVRDPVYAQFAQIFETFKLTEKPEVAKGDDAKDKKNDQTTEAQKKDLNDQAMDTDSDEEEAEKQEAEAGEKVEKLSKKKLKLKNRMSVAELKQHVHRPDVVEMHDVTAPDPKLLVYLKACRNTVPVPRHWCFKRKFLQGKRGIIKPPFQLPEFIQKTGIMEMREALQEKEDAKNMKAKMREKVRPKMGKIDIDYQKLHDAFFKWQTKPKMTIHGDLYYEGKEFETKLKEKKPGDLSEELRTALGMPTGQGSNLVPPPWLIAMQRYGPPPSYPNLKIPGLNAPIPEGASFGYHAGGWGKPPVDEQGRPLYGDVFGVQQTDMNLMDDDQVDSTLWGELESESEESEESEEESEEEAADQSGLVTPAETGLVTPSGLTSIPAGMETPDMIELRKRKNIEEAMESGSEQPTLYTVLPEKRAGVGAMMMGSSHVYDLATAAPTGTKKTPGGLSEGVEVALDPSELELDPAAMQARYDEQLREQQSIQKEDFSDMVAEHAARQQKKRKKTTDSGKAAKKYKEFKF